jgi:hypothetical protein
MRLVGISTAFAAVCATALACSSKTEGTQQGGNATDAAPSDTGIVDCTTDPLAETYSPSMEQAGAGGALKFVLLKSLSVSAQGQMVDGPPALGSNTWILKVLDKSGAPATGAMFPPQSSWPAGWPVGVYPFMPHHGHGSSAWPTVTNNMDGTYTIDNVYLYMAGLWQVTINATSGGQTDSAVFGFCVQG